MSNVSQAEINIAIRLLKQDRVFGTVFSISEGLRLPTAYERDSPSDFMALVDRTLSAKASDPAADTSALEREIDQQVYQLYGLTTEEISIVEGIDKRGSATP